MRIYRENYSLLKRLENELDYCLGRAKASDCYKTERNKRTWIPEIALFLAFVFLVMLVFTVKAGTGTKGSGLIFFILLVCMISCFFTFVLAHKDEEIEEIEEKEAEKKSIEDSSYEVKARKLEKNIADVRKRFDIQWVPQQYRSPNALRALDDILQRGEAETLQEAYMVYDSRFRRKRI